MVNSSKGIDGVGVTLGVMVGVMVGVYDGVGGSKLQSNSFDISQPNESIISNFTTGA
jgi:hypothetical protein